MILKRANKKCRTKHELTKTPKYMYSYMYNGMAAHNINDGDLFTFSIMKLGTIFQMQEGSMAKTT